METRLKELEEKIGGTYWEKGNLRRLYLDRGHNTKKMTTKTFIWEDENGALRISCKIECPSQPYEWVKSQQDQVKKGVMREIEDALASQYFFAKKKGTELYFEYGKLVEYKEVVQGELYPSDERLIEEMENCGEEPEDYEIIVVTAEEVQNLCNQLESKSAFDLSVEEIKEYQLNNLTGCFKTDVNLSENVYNICRNLEKQGKDDKYLRSLKSPLAILFCVNANSQITIVGNDTEYSFWKTVKGEMPMPLASNSDNTYWCYEIYEGTKMDKKQLDNDKVNPQGQILHTYETGYFNSKN